MVVIWVILVGPSLAKLRYGKVDDPYVSTIAGTPGSRGDLPEKIDYELLA
jgi:hypothetical protein